MEFELLARAFVEPSVAPREFCLVAPSPSPSQKASAPKTSTCHSIVSLVETLVLPVLVLTTP